MTVAFDEFSRRSTATPNAAEDVRDAGGVRPEHVESRVAAILASGDFERLPALAEIKFFSHRGLISDGLLEKSFQKVLGEAEGAKLASGTEAERTEVISTLIPPE